MTKKPDSGSVPAAMRESEMNLLAAQTERFDEYRRWVGFRLGLIIIMLVFLLGLEAWRIYRTTQVIQHCVRVNDAEQ